jgi:hypothetical protein
MSESGKGAEEGGRWETDVEGDETDGDEGAACCGGGGRERREGCEGSDHCSIATVASSSRSLSGAVEDSEREGLLGWLRERVVLARRRRWRT